MGRTRIPNALTYVFSLLIAINTIGIVPAEAQGRFEAGITIGPSNFLGDLGGNFGHGMPFIKDNNIEVTRIMKGAYVSFAASQALSFRAAFNIGRLEGADSLIKPQGGHEETRLQRNLHFRSPLIEGFVAAEFHPTVFLERDPDDLYRKLRPYLLLGVGMFRFNPQGQYTDPSGNKTWVDLRPLRTEGQGMPQYPDRKEYSLTALNMPYGVGFRYFLSERFNIGFEVIVRNTNSDYIDDASTRYVPDQYFYDYFGNTFQAQLAVQMANLSNLTVGNNTRSSFTGIEMRGEPRNEDSYYSSNLRIGIRLGERGSSASPYMRGVRDRLRCPIVRF
jgi:hypothetical protein